MAESKDKEPLTESFEETFETIKEEVSNIQVDYPKVLKGQAKAGRRARKALQNLRNLCKLGRSQIMEIRNSEEE